MFKALGIDLISLVWQIVAFILLIVLLNQLLIKPLRKTLDEDRTRVALVARHADAVLVCRVTLHHEPRENAGAPVRPAAPPQTPSATPAPVHGARNAAAATPAATASGQVPLEDALAQGLVTVDVSGAGLSSVRLHAVRRNPADLRVVVPVGTYFANQDGSQSMVSTAPVTLDLAGHEAETVPVPSVCADFHRPQPDSQSRFTVTRLGDVRLRRLAAVIERRRPTPAAAQVAVWAVVDNVSRGQLDGAFVRTQYINGTPVHSGAAVTEADIATARALVVEAGLDVSALQLFR